MRDGFASRTAWGVAIRRAAHQQLDHPPVFEDPFALRILGSGQVHLFEARPPQFEDAPRLRAFVAARSRFAEDQSRASLAAGVEQVVILGAGLDTFAYRNPGLRVFEVDHPTTQAWKRDALSEANIPVPASLTFVPVDFEISRLEDALVNSGFAASRPGFFSWLGVVPYLRLEAFRSTAAWIAGLPPTTGVVFDYSVPPDYLGPQERAAFDALAARVARAGEPFQLFLEPHQVASLLRKLGFHHVQDLGPAEIHQQYFATRADGLTVGPPGHLVAARV